MLDDAGGAVEAARRAARLAPQIARAQSALGFALLAQLKTSDARAAFERAIDCESTPFHWHVWGWASRGFAEDNSPRAVVISSSPMALNPKITRSFEATLERLTSKRSASRCRRSSSSWRSSSISDSMQRHFTMRFASRRSIAPSRLLRDIERSLSRSSTSTIGALCTVRMFLLDDEPRRHAKPASPDLIATLGFEQLALIRGIEVAGFRPRQPLRPSFLG